MKIETKYNLGDKFYQMEGNRPTLNEEPTPLPDKITIEKT